MTQATPPAARKERVEITQLGRTRFDDYSWMKDENWQAVMREPALLRADIRAHLEAENAYTKAMMAPTEALQARLYQEMRGRVKEDDSSVPAPHGPWEYFARYAPGAEHPIYARKPRGQVGPEHILIDVDAQARGKAFYKVSAAEHAPDHTLFAYAVDEQGSEIHTIYVRDLSTGEDLPGPVTNSEGSFAFSPDSAFLFWVHRNENGRSDSVYRRPARGAGDDVLVYAEQDEGFFVHVDVSESGAYILIQTGNGAQSETHTIPAYDPTSPPRLFHARETDLLYSPTHWNGAWRVLTNADGATDFKIMQCAEDQTGRAHWTDMIAYQPGRYIAAMGAYKDFLVRLERVDALPRIVVRDLSGTEHVVDQAEEAYDLDFSSTLEFDTAVTRFVYNSPTTPSQTFDYDMATRTRTLRKTQEIPSGHDPAAYECRRLIARADDGAEIPVTVLMKRGQKLDGSAPMLLYGYGSYGISIDANFSTRRLSLVDRGWVYAIAHVRGGGDKGHSWFEAGRRFTKINTFTDFIASADMLIAQGYTSAGRIVAEGRSAGGLLMGAIANMRPDLWAGIIGGVPFIDVLNTMSDASLPLTPPEWVEWGNPLEDEAAYDYMASYSPYDNIAAKPYPAVLSTGGLTDPRVTYWEPQKWAAKLRAHSTSGRPVLLRMNMDAGHAGAAGRFDNLKEIAHDYAFAMRAVGDAEAGGEF